MCLTMLDPATRWFEMVELPVTDDFSLTGTKQNISQGRQNISAKIEDAYFDKSLSMISNLIN